MKYSNASQGPMDKQSDGSHRVIMGQGLKIGPSYITDLGLNESMK
jgi:hypothetical protein